MIFSLLLLAVCLLRLAQMQLLTASSVQHEIAELKQKRGQSKQLKTIRGRILDRNERVLAIDEARFWVHINYNLSSFLDERVRKSMLAGAAARRDADVAVAKVDEEIREKLEDLQLIIEKCAQFKAVEPSVIWDEIQKINDYVWGQRMFQAWRKNFPKSEVFEKYDSKVSIPFSEAIADFNIKEPDPKKRIELASRIDILEMHENWALLELKTDDDVFAAQLEFMDTEGLHILPKGHRFYPYGSAAAQTIGWVGLATQQQDKELFADDELLSYLEGEVCGREDGIEYVCETVLRGKRGELSHDIDGQLTSRIKTEFGKDVKLTLDITLQERIENYLTNYKHDPNCGPGMSVVVIEVGTCDILALVSLPLYDLNRVRYDYGDFLADGNKPLINRAINEQYPPGSVVKPLILIAGLETGQITPEEIIGCPPEAAPPNWPNCLIFRRGVGHDNQWENNARNAIKGSCNIYFSHLADKIEPVDLQRWLYAFGYGQDVLSLSPSLTSAAGTELDRNFRQSSGVISSGFVRGKILSFEDVPPLRNRERRYFGIGQGDLRVTPLQFANSMAAIARGGIYKRPKLIWEPGNSEGTDLGVSLGTLAVVYDGMSAVVNEAGGSAYRQFEPFLSTLAAEDVKVYGKTGSTERPEHALFGGFAQDSTARKIAIAVVVEGGQHGSSDAAPLARDIIQFCIEAGYVGKSILTAE
ncbi:MAG: penicillin-binding transpeptidase domain-containing protein [Sedimentisphaerales bacterium]